MIRQTLKRSSLLWIFILLPGAGICEDLSIPIEWYYGRWPSGHAAEGHRTVRELISPSGFSAYTYSNGRIKAGVNRFENLLLVSDNSSERKTADFTFGFRPSRNWQISIDWLRFSSGTDRRIFSSAGPNFTDGNFRRFETGLSVDWSNKTKAQVGSRLLRYVEYVDRTVGKGQWLAHSSMEASLHNSNRATIRLLTASSGNFKTDQWAFKQFVRWGVSDVWKFSLDVSNRILSTSQFAVSNHIEVGNSEIQTRIDERFRYFPEYTLSSLYGLSDDAAIKLSVSQQFFGFNSDFGTTIITSDSIFDAPSSGLLSSGSGFGLSRSTVGAQIDIITEGAFVSSIVLDDYAGYYHKMLFPGQYHGQFAFEFRDPGQVRIDFRHSSHYGLTNNINVGSSFSYNWVNSRVIGPRLSSAFNLQWRSYEYRPNSGPGWYSDSPFDIQYGPIKRPGHLYFSVSARPPSWQSHGGQGFLSFGGLRSNKDWGISSSIIAGLPWQLEIRANSSLLLLHNESNFHSFRMAMAKRIWDKLEFSVDYFNDPPSRLSRAAGLADDFELTFNLRGFL